MKVHLVDSARTICALIQTAVRGSISHLWVGMYPWSAFQCLILYERWRMPRKSAVAPDSIIQAEKSSPNLGLERYEMAAQVAVIESEEDYKSAGEILVRLATGIKLLRDYWEGVIRPLKSAYDAAREKRGAVEKRLEAVREIYEVKMSNYRRTMELRRLDMERQLGQAADDLRDALEQEARGLMVAGRMDEARDTLSRAESVVPPTLEFEKTKLDGVTQVQEFDVEITDLMALIKSVAKGDVPLYSTVLGKRVALLEVRESAVREARKSMGIAFDWKGVRVTPKMSYRVKAEG